jgi:hypothetical protein
MAPQTFQFYNKAIANMLYLKVTFGKEIHLVTKKITYSELLTFIQ